MIYGQHKSQSICCSYMHKRGINMNIMLGEGGRWWTKRISIFVNIVTEQTVLVLCIFMWFSCEGCNDFVFTDLVLILGVIL